MASNKRKRAAEDVGEPTNTAEDEFHTSLLQHVEADNQRTTAEAALAQQMPSHPYPDPAFGPDATASSSTGMVPVQPYPEAGPSQVQDDMPPPAANNGRGKGGMGTDEWHQLRKASHKEVERRRREVINDGIEKISKIIPADPTNSATEGKNKGAILARAHNHIVRLNDADSRFDSERAVFKVTIDELSKRIDALQASNRQAWNDVNKWQERCRALGGNYDDFDGPGGPLTFEDATGLENLAS